MSKLVQDLDSSSLEHVTGAEGVVLVDFWAAWCPPCRALAPELEKVAATLDGRIVVAKVDVDANPGLAKRYGVRSLPTMIVLQDGHELGRIEGLQPAATIVHALEHVLDPDRHHDHHAHT
jgi:thioredoxin